MTVRRLLWLLPGAGLLVAGFVLVVTRHCGADDFGWFAYTPLDGRFESSAGSLTLMTRGEVVGWVLVALGLAALTAYAGFWIGRRTAR